MNDATGNRGEALVRVSETSTKYRSFVRPLLKNPAYTLEDHCIVCYTIYTEYTYMYMYNFAQSCSHACTGT